MHFTPNIFNTKFNDLRGVPPAVADRSFLFYPRKVCTMQCPLGGGSARLRYIQKGGDSVLRYMRDYFV